VKRVLIVDDEKSFLLSLRDGLNVHRDEFQVLTAENGREAVAVLRALSIDLLVTDLKLPEMDGFELLAWVSRQQPQLPVIVMTAFGTAEIESRLAQMGALQYLEKPLDLEMLREGIFNGLKGGPKSYIRGITLATFLQLIRADRKNCTLKVTTDGQQGYLYVRRGELIDAEFAELQGEAAAMEIVAWEHAEIEMDGICRRQQQIINLSLEHLLIEAFRRKDEQDRQGQTDRLTVTTGDTAAAVSEGSGEKSPPKKAAADKPDIHPLSAAELARKRLQQILRRHPAVQEYAVFDQKNFLEEKNPGSCSIADFDPSIFTHLADRIAAQLSLTFSGDLSFSTAGRYRYLLFNCRQHQVLSKLKPGSQPQQVIKDIKHYVNR